LQFIDELVGFCQNGQYICDEIGNGSIQLVNNDYLYVPLPFSGINLAPKLMTFILLKKYYFGEYGIIRDSKGLSIPYNFITVH
jgi:hypothetical protein